MFKTEEVGTETYHVVSLGIFAVLSALHLQ